jgi:lysophospholipid acyltransferase (LPLAT)-like uncharacterized protein
MAVKQVLVALKVYCGGLVAAGILAVLSRTVRWTWVNVNGARSVPGSQGIIVAFWHGRLLMMPRLYKKVRSDRSRAAYMLISQHGDGRLIAVAARLLGIRSVAGSSSRGGGRALLELIKKGRTGADLGFTPDGPRGPRYECKDGVVVAAQKADIAVYPFTYSVDRKWQLRSWDGMIIPKPFSRGVCIVGDPIVVADGDDPERARQSVQDALDEITRRADSFWSPTDGV